MKKSLSVTLALLLIVTLCVSVFSTQTFAAYEYLENIPFTWADLPKAGEIADVSGISASEKISVNKAVIKVYDETSGNYSDKYADGKNVLNEAYRANCKYQLLVAFKEKGPERVGYFDTKLTFNGEEIHNNGGDDSNGYPDFTKGNFWSNMGPRLTAYTGNNSDHLLVMYFNTNHDGPLTVINNVKVTFTKPVAGKKIDTNNTIKLNTNYLVPKSDGALRLYTLDGSPLDINEAVQADRDYMLVYGTDLKSGYKVNSTTSMTYDGHLLPSHYNLGRSSFPYNCWMKNYEDGVDFYFYFSTKPTGEQTITWNPKVGEVPNLSDIKTSKGLTPYPDPEYSSILIIDKNGKVTDKYADNEAVQSGKLRANQKYVLVLFFTIDKNSVNFINMELKYNGEVIPGSNPAEYDEAKTEYYHIAGNEYYAQIIFDTYPRYDVTVGVYAGNNKLSSDTKQYKAGSSANADFTVPAGYRLISVFKGKEDVTALVTNNRYTISNISDNVSIRVNVEKIEYKFLDGANRKTSDPSAFVFRIDADYSKFSTGGKVYVDGSVLTAGNFTSASGSTMITLNRDYVATLTAGEHEFKAVFNDGIAAETTFTILSETATEQPTQGAEVLPTQDGQEQPTQGAEVLPTQDGQEQPTQGAEVLPTQGEQEQPTQGSQEQPTQGEQPSENKTDVLPWILLAVVSTAAIVVIVILVKKKKSA